MASLIAVMLVMSMLSGGALAQSGCTSAIVGLAPCLNYISGSSSTPSSSCCSQLSSVVKSQPECLCQVVNGGGSNFGVTINQTQALALPSACKVQTPPVSRCNSAANQPSGSPAGSAAAANQPSGSPAGTAAAAPADSPTSSPADASTPEGSVTPDAPTSPTVSSVPSTGSGSKSSTGNTSDGSMTKYSVHSALFLLFITSCASAIITI